MPEQRYNNAWVDKFIEDAYSNDGVDVRFLPVTMTPVYNHTWERLTGRVHTVFKDEKQALRKIVNENIFKFSGAKTYHEAVFLNSLLFDRSGNKVNFSLFKSEAQTMLGVMNKSYLKTESRTAASNARQILRWEEITSQVKQFPALRYRTVGDKKVRPAHQALDGIILPVDDEFWLEYMPKNGWNCRCWVMQTTIEKFTEVSDTRREAIREEVPDQWRFNPGVEKDVYGPKHPYYQIPKKHQKLASQNFGFPVKKSAL